MLHEFLRQCTCLIPEETADFSRLLQSLESSDCPVAYMPCITWDLWPAYALQCTNARQQLDRPANQCVYLAPIGAHDFWANRYFASIVLDFYRNDVLPEGNAYGFEVDEMLLLNYPGASRLDLQEFGSCSGIYVGLRHTSGRIAHVFFLMEDPSEGWNTVIRQYHIPVDILVDSHKGLGDWFDSIPLPGYMAKSPAALLPQFYFKGKYISHPAPKGCTHLYDIPESRINECTSQLYKTSWRTFPFFPETL